MFFKGKYKRAMDVMRLRNREYLGKMNADNPEWNEETGSFIDEEAASAAETDKTAVSGGEINAPAADALAKPVPETDKTREIPKRKKLFSRKEKSGDSKNPIEKGDISAIILSSALVFGPIFLILAIIIILTLIFF